MTSILPRKAGAVLQATFSLVKTSGWAPENVSASTRRLAADRAGCRQAQAGIWLLASRTVLHAACVHSPSFTLPFCRPIRNLSEQSLTGHVSLAVSMLAVARGASLHHSPY